MTEPRTVEPKLYRLPLPSIEAISYIEEIRQERLEQKSARLYPALDIPNALALVRNLPEERADAQRHALWLAEAHNTRKRIQEELTS